jgi:hypothetical protein
MRQRNLPVGDLHAFGDIPHEVDDRLVRGEGFGG